MRCAAPFSLIPAGAARSCAVGEGFRVGEAESDGFFRRTELFSSSLLCSQTTLRTPLGLYTQLTKLALEPVCKPAVFGLEPSTTKLDRHFKTDPLRRPL